MALSMETVTAQIGKPSIPLTPDQPVNTANQVPNYSQNNSSYTNNSMQNNKPATPNAGPYTGNADYADPTRNVAPPAMYNNNAGQLPIPPPINNPNVPDNTNATIYKK